MRLTYKHARLLHTYLNVLAPHTAVKASYENKISNSKVIFGMLALKSLYFSKVEFINL